MSVLGEYLGVSFYFREMRLQCGVGGVALRYLDWRGRVLGPEPFSYSISTFTVLQCSAFLHLPHSFESTTKPTDEH